jgi:ADP-heptose:LPS heptosyltransferase
MTTYPRWDGTLKHGRRVLIWGEQGLGDTVQFSRLIAFAAERGIEPVLLVQDELVELFQQSQLAKEIYPFSQMIQMQKNQFGQDIFVPRPGILKELQIDAHLPMMSLAHVLNFNPEQLNSGIYLQVSEQKKKAAADYIQSLNLSKAPRIGIVWSGSWSEHPEYQKTSNRRRIPLAKMAPILQNKNLNFFCFQKGFDEIARLEFPQIRPLPLTNSYADTAALLLQMDLLITIDTSICHVAGGLGVPVWLMNRYDTCWRWLTGEGSSIWYPSLEIFKQNSAGDWDSVVAKINNELNGEAHV